MRAAAGLGDPELDHGLGGGAQPVGSSNSYPGRISETAHQSRATLVWTCRTVESHVANALRKLDGSSRREFASLLTDAE